MNKGDNMKSINKIKKLGLILLCLSSLSGCTAKIEEKPVIPVPQEILVKDVDEVIQEKGSTKNTDGVIEKKEKESIKNTTVEETILVKEDFEEGTTAFQPRGDAKIEIVQDESRCLQISDRQGTWQGAMYDLDGIVIPGDIIELSAKVKYNEGKEQEKIYCKIEKDENEYLELGSVTAKKGEWTYLEGSIQIPKNITKAIIYFETTWEQEVGDKEYIDFYLDDIIIKRMSIQSSSEPLPQLKEVYKKDFTVGIGITREDILSKEYSAIITQQFNSITAGNEMKPDYILDYEKCISDSRYDLEPVVKFDQADDILDFAKKNNLIVRGHTLVWHSQTPTWFFKEGYSKDKDAPFVSKEIMLKRMESYIKQVIEYTNEKYPGIVYAWDVVNEAIETGHGHNKGYRTEDSLWYQVIGEEYIEKAFEFARKYADKDVKLFYNDYNTYLPERRIAITNLAKELKEKQLIDGIGMQSHIQLDSPSVLDYKDTICKFGELGLEIHITELDMNTKNNDEKSREKQAQRYKIIFDIFKDVREKGLANVTNVTLWGLTDNTSWLNKDGPTYPLLFDKYLMPKQAFWYLVK